ncbi:MAG: radical SAM protein [Promethearchaeota archaeon]
MVKIKEQIEKICISPNTACNFICKYCYFYNPENTIVPRKSLTDTEIYMILEKIYEYSIQNPLKKELKVIFVGSGEPLLSWKEISSALKRFRQQEKHKEIKFYIVTNGSLLTDDIAKEMKVLEVIPSVSLDGPAIIHDKNRILANGKPTFNIVMEGINILRRNKFKIIINPTITRELIDNLELFFEFIEKEKIDKVIFGRMVDVPSFYPPILYDEYYRVLEQIYTIQKELNNPNIEIGNIESFKKAVEGHPDRVCTLIGSCCGAGTSNIIYLQKEVYPCGRMFNNRNWLLGRFDQDIEDFQKKMIKKLRRNEIRCNDCSVEEVCVKDCLLEASSHLYNCQARKKFLNLMINEFRK